MGTVAGDVRVVELSSAAFSLEAVKRAAYALMARYDIAIEPSGNMLRCVVAAARPGVDMAGAERDLRREALDQDLRITIETRTEAYRDAILGLAFSQTGLQRG